MSENFDWLDGENPEMQTLTGLQAREEIEDEKLSAANRRARKLKGALKFQLDRIKVLQREKNAAKALAEKWQQEAGFWQERFDEANGERLKLLGSAEESAPPSSTTPDDVTNRKENAQ